MHGHATDAGYANAVWTNLEQADIPFTMHWGKFNSF
jgi:hypothetical protein